MKSGVTQQTIENIGINAGVLVKAFDYADNTFADSDIICATRGGGTIACVATMRNIVIDGVRDNTAETQVIDGYVPVITTTGIEITPEHLRRALGAADVETDEYGNTVIQPRHKFKPTDFADAYWVGERTDGAMIVAELNNAFNANGLTITSTDRGEQTVAFELRGHYTVATQDKVPFKITELKKAIEPVTAPIIQPTEPSED